MNNEMLPSFGADLYLYENCNIISNNCSHIGLDYESPQGIEYNTAESKIFLVG
jgi:hypothetical protein